MSEIEILHWSSGRVLWRGEAVDTRDAIEKAIVQGANLQEANLQEANLQGANLQEANLQEANLQGANLQWANLQEAKLQEAKLQGANLQGAKGLSLARTSPLAMLLDQPGAIRAYKLVTQSGEGPFNGGIRYEIGGNYEVTNASTDQYEQCAEGINLATLDWCIREWILGHRILIAEFTAADIAAIPLGTDGKFRVHRCRIVGEKNLAELGLVEKPEGVVS